MKSCLEGVKILELSHYIAAPYCGQLLADLGAEVIKVERPGEGLGDAGREVAPMHNGMSLYYSAYNRNKKAITLDMASEEGKEILLEFVKKADIVLQNFRPGVLEKFGLSYEHMKEVNPKIIMTSISGYGQTGPYKDRSAVDMAIQAVSGYMSVTGFPYGPPTKSGPLIGDFFSAVYAALATVAAYNYREKTGEGQHVDIALLDCMFTLLENYPTEYLLHGGIPPRSGNGRPWTAPCGTYKTVDGYVHLSSTQNGLFKRLCKAMGRDEMFDRPEFATPYSRKEHEGEIEEVILAWLSGLTSDEAITKLEEAGVPCGKVNTIDLISQDVQIAARNMIVRMKDNKLGEMPLVGNPIKMSRAEIVYNIMPSFQGDYNEEVYKDVLGFSQEKLEQLHERKII